MANGVHGGNPPPQYYYSSLPPNKVYRWHRVWEKFEIFEVMWIIVKSSAFINALALIIILAAYQYYKFYVK